MACQLKSDPKLMRWRSMQYLGRRALAQQVDYDADEYWNPCTMRYSTSVCSFGHPLDAMQRERDHLSRWEWSWVISESCTYMQYRCSCSGSSSPTRNNLFESNERYPARLAGTFTNAVDSRI